MTYYVSGSRIVMIVQTGYIRIPLRCDPECTGTFNVVRLFRGNDMLVHVLLTEREIGLNVIVGPCVVGPRAAARSVG